MGYKGWKRAAGWVIGQSWEKYGNVWKSKKSVNFRKKVIRK
jgi:hypothetical protein